MTDTPWTYHTTQIIPSRKSHRVMEGLMPIATCTREKHARQIIGMKEINAELLFALKEALAAVEFMASAIDADLEDLNRLALVQSAIAKAQEA